MWNQIAKGNGKKDRAAAAQILLLIQHYVNSQRVHNVNILFLLPS